MAVTERSALSAMTLGLSEVHLFTNSLIIACLDTMYLDHTNPILPCEVLPKPSPHPHLDFSSPFHSPLSPISAVRVCTGVRPPMGAQATSPQTKEVSLCQEFSTSKAPQLGMGLQESFPHPC